MFNFLKNSILILVLIISSIRVMGQYEDNPLRGSRWFNVAGGINTSDYWSW